MGQASGKEYRSGNAEMFGIVKTSYVFVAFLKAEG
jgi:hypothetical protein